MPKGAKKRKAAKRKKQQEASNNDNSTSINSHNTQGNDDPKSQDERDSDDGEVCSPVAQDHHKDQHLFYKSDEEPDEEIPISVQSALPENTIEVTGNAKGNNKLAPGNDGVVKIDGVLSSQQDYKNNSIAIEHVESTNESHDGDERSSNSSSSCSEEDSEAVEKKGKEEARSTVEIKAIDAFPEQVTLISEKEKSVKDNDNSVVPVVNLDEPVVHLSGMVKHESSQVENPEVVDVVKSGLNESEVQLPPASSEGTAISIVAPKNDEDKILPTSKEKSSISVGSSMCRNDDKITSTDAHPAEAVNDSGNINYSDTSKCTENQPLITSAPRVSQRTPWMSCCGLFDTFIGSGR